MSYSDRDRYESPSRGYVKKALVFGFLAMAAIAGHYFYTEYKDKQAAEATEMVETTETAETNQKRDDGTTAPPAAKRLQEMEQISNMR